MENFRQALITRLKGLFSLNSSVHTAWEGGSAATGFLDEHSDLDLGLICEDDAVEHVFERIENLLECYSGIEHKFRLPEPCWHGHSQCFYKLKKSPPLFYLDLLIEKLSAKNRFMESDRHGRGQVWIDKKRLADSTPTPKDEIEKKGKFYYQITKGAFPFLVMDVQKQIIRKNKIDALVLYHQLLGRLSFALNLKFRPAKYDFGLRYTYRDYPEETASFLEDLLVVDNFDQLPAKLDLVSKKFDEIMAELKDTWE